MKALHARATKEGCKARLLRVRNHAPVVPSSGCNCCGKDPMSGSRGCAGCVIHEQPIEELLWIAHSPANWIYGRDVRAGLYLDECIDKASSPCTWTVQKSFVT